ncbi:ATP-binding protein, partial [Globicatella sanguinis]
QECFKDPTLTGALVDRLAYKAHVVDMRGESYRMKQTSLWKKGLEKGED